jgi:hypothetical protein
MNKYDLTVRGEKIHIEFERINDSRRMADHRFSTKKTPNLFKIKAAMACRVDMPFALTPDWCKNYQRGTWPFTGMGLCFHKDAWSAKKGRHRSLAEALDYPGCDKELNAEITVAFSVEETRRTKVKGPARIPKTAKPKPRRRSTLERIADALEKLANPMQMMMMSPSEIDAAFNRIMPLGNIRPADMPAYLADPDGLETIAANGTVSKGE